MAPATGYQDSSGHNPEIETRSATAPIGARRSCSMAYETVTFPMVTRARRELTVTLTVQPVFDLARGEPVSRRIRRTVRHRGGEPALAARGVRTLETVDLKRIDLQTLNHGRDLLHIGPEGTGVLPAFWRTLASSGGRFALLCAELRHGAPPGTLLVEVLGGLERAPPEAIDEAIAHFETAALGVILHIAPDPTLARRLARVRARCLAIDFAGVEHHSARDWQAAAGLISIARHACPQVMLLNLRPEQGSAARGAGATHAVFSGMEPILI